MLASSVALLNRGCGAQAWSATELYRVLSLAG